LLAERYILTRYSNESKCYMDKKIILYIWRKIKLCDTYSLIVLFEVKGNTFEVKNRIFCTIYSDSPGICLNALGNGRVLTIYHVVLNTFTFFCLDLDTGGCLHSYLLTWCFLPKYWGISSSSKYKGLLDVQHFNTWWCG
jgi:hypothetical protein